MIYWIFDMDDTLYDSNGNFSYNMLKQDNELIGLIKKLKGRKILFTNASHQHTNLVLHKLGLVSSFDLIVDRNLLGVLKPSPIAFLKIIKWCSITPNDTCYFFEDSLRNLIVGHALGWQTIFINPGEFNAQNKYIDIIINQNGLKVKKRATINYTFKNIKLALKHFTSRME